VGGKGEELGRVVVLEPASLSWDRLWQP
jgi:hypothetical protein